MTTEHGLPEPTPAVSPSPELRQASILQSRTDATLRFHGVLGGGRCRHVMHVSSATRVQGTMLRVSTELLPPRNLMLRCQEC